MMWFLGEKNNLREKTQEITNKRCTAPRRSKIIWKLSDFSMSMFFFYFSLLKIMSYLTIKSFCLPYLENNKEPQVPMTKLLCVPGPVDETDWACTLLFGKKQRGKLWNKQNCEDFEVCSLQLLERSLHIAELLYSSSVDTRHGEDWLPPSVANSAAISLNPNGLSLWLSMLAKVVSGFETKTKNKAWTG